MEHPSKNIAWQIPRSRNESDADFPPCSKLAQQTSNASADTKFDVHRSQMFFVSKNDDEHDDKHSSPKRRGSQTQQSISRHISIKKHLKNLKNLEAQIIRHHRQTQKL
jgi:hypothetical protein